MKKSNIREILCSGEVLFLDGAMGTMLEGKYDRGSLPEILNITNPELITDIHKQYVDAGSHVVSANTFGANPLKLSGSGYSVREIVCSAMANAKNSGAKFVALDIGPLGELLRPAGTLGFEDAVGYFKEVIEAGADKADLILIETMSDLYEVKAAVVAAKEISGLPIFVSMTYDRNLRTFMGTDALTAVVSLNAMGVAAIGTNCSSDPYMIEPIVEVLTRYSRVPVFVKPNAGLPVRSKGGGDVYEVTPKQFANALMGYYKKGVSIFGGCCGTNPQYIGSVAATLSGKTGKKRKPLPLTAVTSGTRTEIIGQSVCIIGERINPTGKPKLKDALRNGDMGYVIGEAAAQESAGINILDVNCGMPDIDEPAMLARIVSELQAITDTPLQIDSTDINAIERAVRIYNGKPLINSVTGETASMQRVFAVAKKYGAAVVGLTLDENGIPSKARDRLLIAKRIVDTAMSYGIPKEDIIIDCLVLTASAQQEEVLETIRAIGLVKKSLGVRTVLGVSNVSYGLPNRPRLNGVFLAAALTAGLDSAIVNPMCSEVGATIRSYEVLSGIDSGAARYIEYCARIGGTEAKEPVRLGDEDLVALVASGRKIDAAKMVKAKLPDTTPLEIIDDYLIPALDYVGAEYEANRLFVPQLVQAAEAAKACFDAVRDNVGSLDAGISKGKVVLATVKGDIHDIGKNIAKVLLQSYGYEVIDLGKDVDIETVSDCVTKNNIRLLGLSALMTTTIGAMKDTINRVRQVAPDCKIMVGGAVLSEEYASYVGADYYAVDARAGVRIAAEVLG